MILMTVINVMANVIINVKVLMTNGGNVMCGLVINVAIVINVILIM